MSTPAPAAPVAAGDPALDFASPLFDPLRALLQPGVQPPHPNMKPMESLVKFATTFFPSKAPTAATLAGGAKETALPGAPARTEPRPASKPAAHPGPSNGRTASTPPATTTPLQVATAPAALRPTVSAQDVQQPPAALGAEPLSSARESKPETGATQSATIAQPRRGVRGPKKNVLQRMEDLRDGPLGLLHDCKAGNVPVRVWTRDDKGVRSQCIGLLVLFDKHFNMILCNVLELVDDRMFRVRRNPVPSRNLIQSNQVTAESFSDCVSTASALREGLLCHRTRAKQLFIKGHNVVMVSRFEPV